MTATAAINGSYTPYTNPLPTFLDEGLVASEQAGRGQFVTASPTTGYASLNDGTSPNQIATGICDVQNLTDTSTANGGATVRCSQRLARGIPASTIANDNFTIADHGTPFYIADENTPGKLSNYDGDNRSLGGVVLGLDNNNNPILFPGVVGWLVARAAAMANAFDFANFAISDAAASTATTERVIPSAKMHGVVTGVQFAGAAVPADNSDYFMATLAKRSLSDAYASATTIATYDSRAANNGAITAFTPANWTLSVVAGALNILETDVVTLTVTKAASGQQLIGGIRAIAKVG